MLPNNLIVLRNEGEDQQGRGKDLGGVEDQRGCPDQDGSPNRFDFVSVLDSRNSCTKTDAHVAYGVRFGCSLYGWKDNFKKLPMEPVSGPNSSGVNGNRLHKLTSRIYSGAATPYFGPMGRVSSWSLLGTRPRVRPRP
jgi:hypothetical protein